MKKFGCYVLTFLVIFLNFNIAVFGTEIVGTASWDANNDTHLENHSGENMTCGYLGVTETVGTVGNEKAVELLPGTGGADGDSYVFTVTKDALLSNRETPAEISVKYYDTGNGEFYLEYQTYSLDPGLYNAKKSEKVTLTNTNEWKTKTFTLDRPVFDGSFTFIKGSLTKTGNFRIVNSSQTDSIHIGSVSITQTGTYPITIRFKRNVASNVYTTETLKLPIVYRNINSSAQTQTLILQIMDSENQIIWSKDENITLQANSEQTIEYAPCLTRYGKYKFKVIYTNGAITRDDEMEFALVNGATGIKNERMNINAEFVLSQNTSEYLERIDLVNLAGFGSIRSGLYWSDVEKTAGEYKLPDDSIDDEWNNNQRNKHRYSLPKHFEKNNFTTIINLAYGNPLYIPEGTEWDTSKVCRFPRGEEAVSAFVEYCKWTVKTYKEQSPGKVKYYALWNEFNGGFNHYDSNPNSGDRRATSEEYAEVLKKIYPAIKAIDPDAKVIAMVAADGEQIGQTKMLDFIDEVMSYDTYDYFDVISVHPYLHLGSKNKKLGEDIKAIMDKYRGDKPRKEVYYTECGWPESHLRSGLTFSSTEAAQAAYIVKMYAESIACDLGTKFWWYDLMDKYNSGETEDSFGMLKNVNYGGYAKDTYIAVCGLNDFMYDAEYKESLTADTEFSAYSFDKSDGTNIAVVWQNVSDNAQKLGDKKSVTLDLQTDMVEVYDLFTNKVETITSEDGFFTFDVNAEPIYVCGEFNSFRDLVSESSYSIENFGNRLKVDVSTVRADADISILLKDLGGNVAYIDQGKSNKSGVFTLEIPFELEGFYTASIHTGDSLFYDRVSTFLEPVGYEITRNGQTIYSLSQIKSGDEISLKVSFNPMENGSVDIYTAFYDPRDILKTAQRKALGNDNTVTFDIHIDDAYDIQKWTVFVWGSDYQPLTKEIVLIP